MNQHEHSRVIVAARDAIRATTLTRVDSDAWLTARLAHATKHMRAVARRADPASCLVWPWWRPWRRPGSPSAWNAYQKRLRGIRNTMSRIEAGLSALINDARVELTLLDADMERLSTGSDQLEAVAKQIRCASVATVDTPMGFELVQTATHTATHQAVVTQTIMSISMRRDTLRSLVNAAVTLRDTTLTLLGTLNSLAAFDRDRVIAASAWSEWTVTNQRDGGLLHA